MPEFQSDKPPIRASYPRRNARLIGYISAIVAGLSYIAFPPITSINQLSSALPAKLWGCFFALGGLVSVYAWVRRVLTLDRIGLSLIMIGLGALIINQHAVLLSDPSWTRAGGTAILIVLFAFLVSRWQDVKHDEDLAEEAMTYSDD